MLKGSELDINLLGIRKYSEWVLAYHFYTQLNIFLEIKKKLRIVVKHAYNNWYNFDHGKTGSLY